MDRQCLDEMSSWRERLSQLSEAGSQEWNECICQLSSSNSLSTWVGNSQPSISNPLIPKLTIVLFLSSTKLFFVNLLKWRIKKGGSLVHLYLLIWPLASSKVIPSYLAKTWAKGTWGIMFFSKTSWKTGGVGRSKARSKKGEWVVLISVWRGIRRKVRMIERLSSLRN